MSYSKCPTPFKCALLRIDTIRPSFAQKSLFGTKWALQWKMKLNPEPNKQAQEAYFSNRTNKDISLFITFNNSKVETILSQEHLGLILDQRHLESKVNNCYKIIGFLKRLSNKLPRVVLIRIYKSFVKNHLDYGDIVYDKPNNKSLTSKLEKMQYRACLATTRAFQVTSCERLNKELGLESLSYRRWTHKLTFFYKIVKANSLQYLSDCLKGNNNSVYDTRSNSQIALDKFNLSKP